MAASMMMPILLVGGLAVGAFVFKDQIAAAVGNFQLPGGGGGGGAEAYAPGGSGNVDLDVSGENACACANGRCIGNCPPGSSGGLPAGMSPIDYVKSKVPGAFSGQARLLRRHRPGTPLIFHGYNQRGGRVFS